MRKHGSTPSRRDAFVTLAAKALPVLPGAALLGATRHV